MADSIESAKGMVRAKMEITPGFLDDLRDLEKFRKAYTGYVISTLGEARLFPQFSPLRLIEAHGAWLNDLQRLANHEPNLEDGADHFKQSGHLAFWLRRMDPVVDAIDMTTNLADPEGMPLTKDEDAFRNLLFGYHNEYLAFDFGYQICKFYELGKDGGSERAASLAPSTDYYKIMCHFLKYKNVSPHAMFLVYKSLFL